MATELRNLQVNFASIVDFPANPGAHVMLLKRGTEADVEPELDPIIKRTFTADERKKLAESGAAMSDGSYPIQTKQDLMNARHAVGRAAPGKRSAVIAHIKRRAKALGVELPDDFGKRGLAQRITEALTGVFKDAGMSVDGDDDDDTDTDFNQELLERRLGLIRSDLYDYFGALQDALVNILAQGADDARIKESLDQFTAAIGAKLAEYANPGGVEKAGKKISADRLARMKAMHGTLSDMITEQDPTFMGPDPKKTKTEKRETPMADTVTVETVLKSVTTLTDEQRTALAKRAESNAGLAEVLKSDNAGLRAYVISSELEKMATEAQLEKSQRETAEQIEKGVVAELEKRCAVGADFGHLRGTPIEKATLLRKVQKGVDAETFTAVETILKAASAALKESAIYKLLGDGQTGGGSAWSEIQKLAAEKVQKDGGTIEQAVVAVSQAHPELRKRYEAEKAQAH